MTLKLIVASAAIVALSGCASIIKGGDQEISVESANAASSSCTVTGGSKNAVNETFTTPAVITLPRSGKMLNFACTNGTTENVSSSIEPWTAGNIILGGPIGLGIDALTGAIHKYPNEVVID